MKVRHSVVTDNYIAAEEIQNQNWQYFIQRVYSTMSKISVDEQKIKEDLLSKNYW